MAATLRAIQRFPVKGLSAETLATVELEPGHPLPGDRRFALAHGASRFDPARPEWKPKTHFLTLERSPRLAELVTRHDEATGEFVLAIGDAPALHARLDSADGRASVERFLGDFVGPEARGAVRLVEAPGTSFQDVPAPMVSLVGLDSIADLARGVGAPLDARRFRANLHVEGLPPWHELGWEGRRLAIGPALFKVEARIERCAAIDVDPDTGRRDLRALAGLQRRLGHLDCGVYLRVLCGGRIAPGDPVALAE